jgi:LPS-assembly lipoprotein
MPAAPRIGVCLALAAAALLAACGFRPLHGGASPTSSPALADIAISTIPDRSGQMLHNLLLDRISPTGAPASPRYLLDVQLTETVERLAIRRDETATRANLSVVAGFSLRRVADNAPVLAGAASSTGSFNILRNEFATLSAENDVRRRVLREISDDIRTRVAIFLDRPISSTTK